MSHRTLMSVAELQPLLNGNAAPLLIDCSFDLADTEAGRRAYVQGHLPGAHYLHLDEDLSGAKTDAQGVFRGRHPLPDRERLAATLAGLGLTAGRQLVAYDAQGGMYAARLWWLARWLGHEAVAVLDGGLPAWRAAGLSLSAELPSRPTPGSFEASAALERTLDAEALQQQLGRLRLVDARAPERYRGDVEPLDARAGHIPGARNRFFKDNLQADGRFKPAEQLKAEFLPLLAPYASEQVVHQCGSGVTACHNLLAMRHAGLSGAALYPGSWSEWSADPERSVARG
ncbi:sulfurtransferase [Pelomonas sp. CA6]|uniref:sulfurtransferase n=1 Tax=Pelomonas sp. CA6 TaxID=2907999 RepID=UPI0035A822FE